MKYVRSKYRHVCKYGSFNFSITDFYQSLHSRTCMTGLVICNYISLNIFNKYLNERTNE